MKKIGSFDLPHTGDERAAMSRPKKPVKVARAWKQIENISPFVFDTQANR